MKGGMKREKEESGARKKKGNQGKKKKKKMYTDPDLNEFCIGNVCMDQLAMVCLLFLRLFVVVVGCCFLYGNFT